MASEGRGDHIGEGGEGSGSTHHVHWTPAMSSFMLSFLSNLVVSGTRTSSTFKRVHLNQCAKALNDRFKRRLTADNIKNHLRTWHRKYGKISQVRMVSGTRWDEKDCINTMDDEHYASHTKDHKGDAEYLNKPLQHYNEMLTIFGSSMASGMKKMGQLFLPASLKDMKKVAQHLQPQNQRKPGQVKMKMRVLSEHSRLLVKEFPLQSRKQVLGTTTFQTICLRLCRAFQDLMRHIYHITTHIWLITLTKLERSIPYHLVTRLAGLLSLLVRLSLENLFMFLSSSLDGTFVCMEEECNFLLFYPIKQCTVGIFLVHVLGNLNFLLI